MPIVSGVAASVTNTRSHDSAAQALTSGYNAGVAVSAGLTIVAVLTA